MHTIRTQGEIQNRYTVAVIYSETEAVEYLRQLKSPDFDIESYLDIDRTAKQYIAFMLRSINRGKSIRLAIAQYVAWKWLLGHPDADTFPGAHDKPNGLSQRETYLYLITQISTGEWDRLTKQAKQEIKNEKQRSAKTSNSERQPRLKAKRSPVSGSVCLQRIKRNAAGRTRPRADS